MVQDSKVHQALLRELKAERKGTFLDGGWRVEGSCVPVCLSQTSGVEPKVNVFGGVRLNPLVQDFTDPHVRTLPIHPLHFFFPSSLPSFFLLIFIPPSPTPFTDFPLLFEFKKYNWKTIVKQCVRILPSTRKRRRRAC